VSHEGELRGLLGLFLRQLHREKAPATFAAAVGAADSDVPPPEPKDGDNQEDRDEDKPEQEHASDRDASTWLGKPGR
jgi:hypothetical protein